MRDGGRGNMRLDVVDSPGVGNKAIFVTGAVAGSKIIPVGWVLLSNPHPPYNLSELLLIKKNKRRYLSPFLLSDFHLSSLPHFSSISLISTRFNSPSSPTPPSTRHNIKVQVRNQFFVNHSTGRFYSQGFLTAKY